MGINDDYSKNQWSSYGTHQQFFKNSYKLKDLIENLLFENLD